MARYNYRNFNNNNKIKSIFSAVLVVALLIGSVVGLTTVFNKDTKSISPTAFSIGSVDENGNYTESKTSIYTKDLMECQGLTIEPDFEASGTYQVYYYGADKNYIGVTAVMDVNEGVYTKNHTFPLAKYCRIVIIPEVPTDDNGREIKDFAIKWYEVSKYASNYSITVDKKQNFAPTNYFEANESLIDSCYHGAIGSQLVTIKSTTKSATKNIDVSEIEAIRISYEDDATVGMYEYFFLDAEGLVVACDNNLGLVSALNLEVPEGAVEFVCNFEVGHTFIINQLR